MAVKDVIFEVKLLPKGDTRGIDAVKKKVAEATKAVDAAEKGTEEYTRAQFKLAHANKELSNTMDGVSKRADGLGGRLGSLKTVLAGVFAAGVLQQFGRAAFNTVADFDQAMANLSAITGATGKDLEFFEEQAKKIGSTTSLSATQAAQAFEIIGSEVPTLLKNKEALAGVTEEAVSLAEAAGITLPEAASALASGINQFGLSGNDASRIINALAAGSKEGSANVTLITETFKNSGKVLADANVSFEQAVALTETLSAGNLKGAEAGTALRGVILKLQAAGIGYASGQFDVADALAEATSKIEAATTAKEKDLIASKLFGQEGITAGKILLSNKEQFEQLTKAVTGTTVAYEQQETRTNTIRGALDRLKSAYEGLLLRLSSSSGILQKSLDFLAENLGSVLTAVATLTVAVIGYNKAAAIKNGLIRVNIILQKTQRAASLLSAAAQAIFTGNTKRANAAMRLFNATLRLNPAVAITGAILALGTAFLIYGRRLSTAQRAAKNYNDTRVKAIGDAEEEIAKTKVLIQVVKDETKSKEERNAAIEELRSINPEYFGDLDLEKEKIEGLDEAYSSYVKSITKRAEIDAIRSTISDVSKKILDLKTGAKEGSSLLSDLFEKILPPSLIASKAIRDGLKAGADIKVLEKFRADLISELLKLESDVKKVAPDAGKGVSAESEGTDDDITDSISFLEKALSKAKQELNNLSSTDAIGIADKIKEIEAAQKALEEAKERVFGKEVEGREDNRLKELAEEERFYIAKLKIAGASEEDILVQQQFYAERRKLILEAQQKDQTLEYQKLTNDIELLERKQLEARKKILQEKETEEQRHQLALLDIHGATELAKLKLTRKFEDERLKTLEEGTLEYIKQQNKVAELDAKIAATRKEETRSALNDLVAASQNAAQVITDAQIAAVDAQVNAQQSRIEQARELADKGNADILEAEEKRLDQLQRKREQFVRAQQALAAAELIANSLVAVSKSAAEGGAAAPITIAATLIALAAGLVGARQAAQNAVSFREGGRAEWSKLTGYTGSGNPNTKSTTLGEKPYDYEYEEYIFPKEVVEKGNNRKWFEKIRKGRIDLDKLPMASLRGKHSITPAFNQMIERSIQMDVQMKGGGVSNEAIEGLRKDLNHQMSELRSEIKNQPSASINVTEKGIEHIVETADFKKTRMKKIR